MNGIVNASDGEWPAKNNLSKTIASPYILVKCATGDFNHDGYANEVAMLTADKKGINLCVYQIRYGNNGFEISTMSDVGRIYSYSNPDYITTWNYNGWNRVPSAEVLAGDFDGDGQTEIGVVFHGDIASGKRNVRYYGGTTGSLFTYLYKWNNQNARFDAKTHETGGVYTSRFYDDSKLKQEGSWPNVTVTVTNSTHKCMIWGGMKAITADIDGDGTDEIVFTEYQSELEENVVKTTVVNGYDSSEWSNDSAYYSANPYLGLIKIASDGNLKPLDNYIWKAELWSGGGILNRSFLGRGNNEANRYNVQEYMLAPVGQNSEVFPFADREMSLTAGPLFGQSGAAKERDDVALRLYGGKMVLFKSNGSSLYVAAIVDARGTSAIVAGDFAAEGIELGKPIRIENQNDRSYTAVLQGIPYHVDTISADGKSVTAEPVNFSYTKGSKAEYATSSTESAKNNTTFNMSATLDTIYALDSDTTRNVVNGIKKFNDFYGTIKTVVSKIPGGKAVDSVASPVLNFLSNMNDKVDTINSSYNNELEEKNVFKSIYSDRFDVVSYVYANQYLWRYPILAREGTYFGTASKDMKYLAKQDFVTFAMYDDPNSDTFGSDQSYQPTHENGNLFSYPAAVVNIEGYNYRQKDLSDIAGVQFGIPTTINQEKFTLTLPNADGARLLGSYRVEAQAYIAEDGALTCRFAVNHFDQYASLFNSGSLYRQHPDPSFVLQKKFVLKNSTPLIPEFGANTERELAMEMRGVRFYAIDFNMYTTNRLLDGAKYRVEVPLYNASFQSANNVRVDLYWVNNRTEAALSDKHFIATTYVNMTGWADTGNNKAWAKFEFTDDAIIFSNKFYGG